MAAIEFPRDFSEFLRLLNAHRVNYLLIGGFAVALHGYPRSTSDMDIWIERSRDNAERLIACLQEFGFDSPALTLELFTASDSIVQMGITPVRIDVVTSIDGVNFAHCQSRALTHLISNMPIRVISLDDLKANKRASGRPKDIDDLRNLP